MEPNVSGQHPKRWMGLRADNEKRKQTSAFYSLLVFRTLGWINNVFSTLGGL
jgi:hypothetical protein